MLTCCDRTCVDTVARSSVNTYKVLIGYLFWVLLIPFPCRFEMFFGFPDERHCFSWFHHLFPAVLAHITIANDFSVIRQKLFFFQFPSLKAHGRVSRLSRPPRVFRVGKVSVWQPIGLRRENHQQFQPISFRVKRLSRAPNR